MYAGASERRDVDLFEYSSAWVPDRVPLRLSVLATLLALTTPAMHRREGDPKLERPLVTRIALTPDTVWFCAMSEDIPDSLAFAFNRRTREWALVPIARATRCASASRVREFGDADTLRAGDGVLVIQTAPPLDSTGVPHGLTRLEVVDSRRNRRTRLERTVEGALLARIEEGLGLSYDTVSTFVSAAAVTDSTVWLGLAGGFPEGSGEFGGLYRIDRATGRHELITDKRLDATTITGIASIGRWLWIGTLHPAEYGPYGGQGVLRFDQSTREWKSYPDSSAPIPDALIHRLDSDGRIIAVATERGMAIIEPRQVGGASPASADPAIERFSIAWFLPRFSGDTLRFTVGTKAQFDTTALDESRYMFVQRYAKHGHERPMFEVTRRAPASAVYDALSYGNHERIGTILADTTMLSVLLPKFRGREYEWLIGAVGLARLGGNAPPGVRGEIRRIFDTADTIQSFETRDEVRRVLGRALAVTGDSAPTLWAREVLRRRVESLRAGPTAVDTVGEEISAAAGIVSATRDRVGLGLLISVAASRLGWRPREAVVEALVSYDDANAWRALTGFARDSLLPPFEVLNRLTPAAIRDHGLTAMIIDLLKKTGSDGKGSWTGGFAYRVAQLRVIELAPTLVGMLEPWTGRSDFDYEGVVSALVSLTGRSDAPTYTSPIPPAAVIQFWKDLIGGPGGLSKAVDTAVGDKAESVWYARQEKANPRP